MPLGAVPASAGGVTGRKVPHSWPAMPGLPCKLASGSENEVVSRAEAATWSNGQHAGFTIRVYRIVGLSQSG